jgi:tellurite resistance protein
MTGILALKKYYRQMETKELERERSEIERELVSRKKDRQLKTALALINNELSNRIIRDRENLLNQQCPKSFPILSDHNIETGEHMTVTIDSLPVDANDLTEEQCVLYLSVIISVCRADGLSEAETKAIKDWMETVGIKQGCFDTALSNTKPASELIPDEKTRKWLAPYVIRDAIRLASVDGFSEEELETITTSAKELGCAASDVENIRDFIALSSQAQDKWPA